MGCHTWFKKKIDVSIEDARKIVINQLQYVIDDFSDLLENPNTEENSDLLRVYQEWTPDYITQCISIYNRQIRMIEKKLCNCAVFNKYNNDNGSIFIKNKGMYDGTEYHDLFRKYGFPNTILHSLKESVDYITNDENSCHLYLSLGDTIAVLTKFWKKYPDGIIYFG